MIQPAPQELCRSQRSAHEKGGHLRRLSTTALHVITSQEGPRRGGPVGHPHLHPASPGPCRETHSPCLPCSGIAVDKNGLMYFVDATMIRKVDQNGIISTLLGSNDLTAVRPLSCDSSMDVAQVGLSLCFSSLTKPRLVLGLKFSPATCLSGVGRGRNS